jgi:NhaP-type Na+/H+ and K+/H+ antiporter
MYNENEKWHDTHEERRYGESGRSSEIFWGFTLSGNARLEDVARFYGLKVPDLTPAVTVGAYLAHNGNGQLRPGYRAAVGGAELQVLEAEDGAVRKVGLELRPARHHRPWRREGKRPRG